MVLDVAGAFASGSDVAASAATNPSQAAISSTEQIFSPVTIRQGRAKQPNDPSGFEVPQTLPNSNGTFSSNHIGPTRTELDPYFSTALTGNTVDHIKNVDYQMMMSNGNGQNGGDANIRKLDRSTINAVSVNHFRGPMIMSGWGFDLGDRPAPALSNDEPFRFDPETVNNRSVWKAGPIDFKWDIERKVWSMGHQMLHGVADGPINSPVDPCTPTFFNLKVFRNNHGEIDHLNRGTAAASVSNCDLSETVIVTNRDPSLQQDNYYGLVYVVCARINYEWVPIWVGCPDEENERVSELDGEPPACVC